MFALVCALALAPVLGSAQSATKREAPSGRTAAKKPAAAASTKAREPAATRTRTAVRAPVRAGGEPGQRVRMTKVSAAPRSVVPARPSIGQAIGLHAVDDPLDLRSSVALVVDQRSGETLYAKNELAVLPIASITKLMTAMVVLDAQLSLTEVLEISEADIDTEKHTRSRLRPGTRLTRSELLQLALMSSENRAAHALGRHYPGGLDAFVAQMNAKAREIGMRNSSFVEPTGLSSRNVSNARDLAVLVRAGFDYPLVRQYSTATELTVDTGPRQVSFRSTNRLVHSPDWSIGLQKTGYISEAGSCLVMQASVEGRDVLMVLLDATGVRSRFGDAQRLRSWIESEAPRRAPVRADAPQPSLGS
jgi:D-alanyl-D-alanine endopeptidase (penicillin-binding protein 7)